MTVRMFWKALPLFAVIAAAGCGTDSSSASAIEATVQARVNATVEAMRISTVPPMTSATTVAIGPPTPTATESQFLAVGERAKLHRMSIIVTRWEPSVKCAAVSARGGPAEGAKFIIVYVAAKNETADVLEMPSILWKLGSYKNGLGTGSPGCFHDERSFGNVCWKSAGKLFPGVSCEGWIMFEVPERFEANGAVLQADAHRGASAWWRL